MSSRTLIKSLAIATAFLTLAACSRVDRGDESAAPAQDKGAAAEIRLGYFPNVTHAAALIGVDKGLFSKELGTTERRLVVLVGNIALAQMLPDSAIKGGTGLKLRFGELLTRDTPTSTRLFVATSMSSRTSLQRSSLRDGVALPAR